jgi:hypothetical protein
MAYISEKMDLIAAPLDWYYRHPLPTLVHILSYPRLFRVEDRITFFRSINDSRMLGHHHASKELRHLVKRMSEVASVGMGSFEDRLRTDLTPYLVLEISREHILEDAMGQLWRRQRRELLSPLKVRMGILEGEEGVDHGGIQQEFFRLALERALDPDCGMRGAASYPFHFFFFFFGRSFLFILPSLA